jgi:hypothetical protein
MSSCAEDAEDSVGKPWRDFHIPPSSLVGQHLGANSRPQNQLYRELFHITSYDLCYRHGDDWRRTVITVGLRFLGYPVCRFVQAENSDVITISPTHEPQPALRRDNNVHYQF